MVALGTIEVDGWTEAVNPEGFHIPITHTPWDLLQVMFCQIPRSKLPDWTHVVWTSLKESCPMKLGLPYPQDTVWVILWSATCLFQVNKGVTWVNTSMSLLSVPMLFHAEFRQYLLLGVVKGEVKVFILKLYQFIQKNMPGMVGERRAESLVTVKGKKISSGLCHEKVWWGLKT